MKNLILKCILLLIFVIGITISSLAYETEISMIFLGEWKSFVVKDDNGNTVTEVEIWENGKYIFTSESGKFSTIPNKLGVWICEAQKDGKIIRRYEITVIMPPAFVLSTNSIFEIVLVKKNLSDVCINDREAILRKYC